MGEDSTPLGKVPTATRTPAQDGVAPFLRRARQEPRAPPCSAGGRLDGEAGCADRARYAGRERGARGCLLRGADSARDGEDFPVSGHRAHPALIAALGTIKRAAAEVNADLGLLDRELAEAISERHREVADHVWDDQFVVDVFQAGAGTRPT